MEIYQLVYQDYAEFDFGYYIMYGIWTIATYARA
jgi:hypothetical protein